MPHDNASLRPGEQGWGFTNWTIGETRRADARVWNELGELVPDRLMRHSPRETNAELMEKVEQIQEANGIEEGFCFLYLVEAIFGSQFNWLAQKIGSCVASGDMRTTAYRMLSEVFVFGQAEELPGIDIDGTDALAFFAPYSYRAGRRIGGLNGGDGSFCSAHIRGKMQYGHLPCSTPGINVDTLPEPQSAGTYRTWGNSNSLLDQFAPTGRKYPLMESEEIKTADDAIELLTVHQKPMNICSSWGFRPREQHSTWKLADGTPVWLYQRSGSWAHNMSVIGAVKISGQWMIVIENSWGSRAHKNGHWFAVTAELFNTWLRSADCRSVGEIDLSDNPSPWPED